VIKTLMYADFPTHLQQPFSVLQTQAHHTFVVTDTVYSARFKHIAELKRMGATGQVEGRSSIIKGATPLTAASVTATDLRAGAALVIAGLLASGETEIHDIYHIERGYSGLIEKLRGLGAVIDKVTLTSAAVTEEK
ncbi:MAG: UDP-N-acetylglucosamine 1-carboxyvinyltransferase, partial [Kurthia sp.]|nr:UDP-N-acetylglucosamine 1-carboxyvinyltransferase [Kurthia sp.]